MNTREETVELECEGMVIDQWVNYSAASDLFTPADAFRMTLGVGTSSTRDLKQTIETLKRKLAKGTEVKLHVTSRGKRSLQGVFVIDATEVGGDADSGTTFTIEARDRAAKLLTAADPKLYALSDTLVSVARKTVAPWNIEVTADHVAARDLRQARVTKDKLRRLQNKARAAGIAPRLMSEKIAASIDKGTITFDEFLKAQVGGYSTVVATAPNYRTDDGARVVRYEKDRTFLPKITRQFGGYFEGVPYSGQAGISSLKIYQLKVKDIRPQTGETRWEFLDRSAKRNGLLMSMSPEGKLLMCGLHYDQEPSYFLTRRINNGSGNTILSGSAREDISDVYREVIVYGRAKGKDKARSPFKGHAISDPKEAAYLPYERTLEIRDNSIRSKEDAQRRAEYELGKSKQGALVLEYTVQGHSQNGLIFATDTIAHVEDEVTGISGPHYVVARTFTRGAKQAPLTALKLVPPGSIVLSKEGDLADGDA